MPLLESQPPQLGAALPSFALPRVDGGLVNSHDLSGQAVAVFFLCGHCPYVQAVEERIVQLGRDFQDKPVQFLAICSNDPTDYPEDSPAALAQRVQDKGYPFPYLVDESQEVARAFEAVCTPEYFVYNAQHQLAYHGRLDNNWKEPENVSREELRDALEAILAGQPAPEPQHPSMGCSIKWKA